MEREARAPVRAREGVGARRRPVRRPRRGDRSADGQQAARPVRRGEELERQVEVERVEVEEQRIEVEVEVVGVEVEGHDVEVEDVRVEVEEQSVEVEVVGFEVQEQRLEVEGQRLEVEVVRLEVEVQRVEVEVVERKVEGQRLEVEVIGLEVEEQLVALEALTGAQVAEPDREANLDRDPALVVLVTNTSSACVRNTVRGNVIARQATEEVV